MTSDSQAIHQQKIQKAKSLLEEHEGKSIKHDKIQEWALLDIAEHLSALRSITSNINTQLNGIADTLKDKSVPSNR